MTTGDAAAAVGLSVVPATKDYRLGYDDINRRGDELANHMTNGGHPFSKISGTVATAQIATSAVTTPKLATASVTTPKLADGAVTAAKLADPTVWTSFGLSEDGWTTGTAEYDSYAIRYPDGQVSLRLAIRRSGATITANDASGGISDVSVFSIENDGAQPAVRWITAALYYSQGRGTYPCLCSIETNGTINLLALAPGIDLAKTAAGSNSLIVCSTYPGKAI